jgi:hypothetical protein
MLFLGGGRKGMVFVWCGSLENKFGKGGAKEGDQTDSLRLKLWPAKAGEEKRKDKRRRGRRQ